MDACAASMPTTWAPILASRSVKIPPPQPTSKIDTPVKGSAPDAAAELILFVLISPSLTNGTLTSFMACKPLAGPSGSHLWPVIAWNLLTSSWLKVPPAEEDDAAAPLSGGELGDGVEVASVLAMPHLDRLLEINTLDVSISDFFLASLLAT